MRDRLIMVYYLWLAPAIAGFIGVYLSRYVHQPPLIPVRCLTLIAPAIFILTAFVAIAGPILLRSFFAHQQKNHSKTSQTVLFKFERMLIGISMIAPYLALVAYYLQLPRFHVAGTFLMALYAVYYYYPSAKRLALDKHVYRVADTN